MRLVDPGGDRFELEILGYQFSDSRHADDMAWLRIHIKAQVDGRSWTADDPCLMADEIDLLATSLELASEGYGSGREIEFLEPNLVLEIGDATGPDVQLRVWFELELRPPWAQADGVPMRDLAATLTVSRADVAEAAADLRQQRRKFPDRLPRSR